MGKRRNVLFRSLSKRARKGRRRTVQLHSKSLLGVERLEERLVFDAQPWPLPLAPVDPAGSLIYQSIATGNTFASETDSRTISLESGQRASIKFSSPASSWSGTITFAGPNGVLFDSGALSLSSGSIWTVESLLVPLSGEYSFSLHTAASGTENYQVSLHLNAGLEDEAHSGPSNDSVATAESLESTAISFPGLGGSRLAVQGKLNGSPDFYSFEAPIGQAIDVMLASPASDTKLEIYDALNRLVASGIRNAEGGSTSIRGLTPIATGTLFVRISGTSTADYSVVVARSIGIEVEPNDTLNQSQNLDQRTGVLGAISGAPLITTETEPNDNGTAGWQATDLPLANDLSGSFLPIGSNQYRAVVTGVVSSGNDNGWDFFKILAGAGDTLIVNLEGSDTSAGSLSDPYSHLYNSSGTRLTFDDDAGTGYNSRFTYSFTAAGEYYIVADSYSSETGSYRLTAVLTTQNPRVGAGSDDFYSVNLTAGSVVDVQTRTPGVATGNSLDPKLEIYDPSGLLVASDANGGGDGRNALISYTAAASGRYVIKLSGGGTRGDYLLSVAGGAAINQALQVSSITPVNGAVLNVLPSTVEVTFNQPLLLTSVSSGDLSINGIPATNVTVVDGDTLRFDVSNAVTADGVYTIVLGAGAIQGLSGSTSEFFLSNFDADATGPVVISSSIAEGAVVAPGDITYQITLNEPINPAGLGIEDLSLTRQSGGTAITPTSFLVSGSGTVITATFSNVPEGDYRLTLLSGAQSVRDLRGNLLDGGPSWPLPSGGGAGGDNFVINFAVDAATVAFPTPLEVTHPVGGFVYGKSLSAAIGNATDVDDYTLNVEAGQRVTIALTADPTLRGTIELRDAVGNVVATTAGAAPGSIALIQSALVDVAGEYSVRVSSADGTTGAYGLRVILNANLELESVNGTPNDSLASAESLIPTTISVLAGTSRLAAIGRSNGESDYFRFSAAVGQVFTVAAAPISGSVPTFELYNSSGTQLAVSLLDGEGVTQNVRNFVVPVDDEYFVRIRGLGTTEYGLAVLVGSDIDVEPNDDFGKPQSLDGSSTVFGGLQIGSGEVATDFSDTVGNLSLEGFTATGLWHVTDKFSGPTEGHSGLAIAYFGSDATGDFNLGTVSGTLTSAPIALRGGTSPTLSFSYRLEGETSTTWDRAFVRVSTNGGQSWDTVASKSTILSQSLTWRRVNVDLSSYAGQTVLLQYLFESGDGVSNNFLGWQLDDISVTGVQDVQDHYAFNANDGDHLVITTTTPGDSSGEPANALDARIDLYNEAGLLIATNDNSASDGRNPRIAMTVPAGQGGRLTARLTSSNGGSYALSISGSTASNVLSPTVTSVLPQNGRQLATAPTSLLFTFSESIRVDSVSTSDLLFADPAVSVTGIEFIDGRNVRFTLNIPNADGVYDYSLNAGTVLDLQGMGNAGFSGSFNVDHNGPAVVSTSPSTQASAPFSQIRFAFDEAIDPASFSTADVIAFSGPSGSLLSAITGVEVVINELIVRFQGQVVPGPYTMQIGPNIADLVGNLMNQDQDEVNGETVGDRYSVTLNLQAPDLIVDSPQTVANALFGQTISVQYGVRNIGDDPALESWFDAVYLSTDATLDRNDLRLTSVPTTGTFGPLDAAGGAVDRYARTASVTLPLNDSVVAGTYYLIVATDDGADQSEANEVNNIVATAGIMIATPPSVDLRVTNIIAPVEALSGQTIPLTWTITNSGAADFTGTFRDQIYLSADAVVGSDQFFGNFDFTGTIPAGGSVTRTQQITLPLTLADDRYVIVRTDANNSVFELGGENNNTLVDNSILDVRLSPFPDLRVADVIAPSNAFSDQSVVVEWIVTNNGNGSTNAPTWTDRVYLSTDQVFDANDTLLGSVNNPAFLAAGDSYRSALTATLPRGIDDNYYFIVRTDVFNNVNELNNENDNTGVSDVTDVQLTPPPDLRVTTVQAPAASFSGQLVTASWTVTNGGPGATRSAAWSDRVYFSADNVLDASDTLLTTVGHSGALEPGASYSASGDGTLPIGVSGNFFFIVQTDAFNQVFEHVFEANNTGFDSPPTAVSLTPPPDLEVELVDAPASATSSRSLTVNYRVTNFGATETPNANWNDRLFLSADNVFDPATDLQIATRTHFGGLEPGESYNESFTTTLSNTIVGSYFVFVVTDFGNAVFELDNDNNIDSDATPLVITSQPANLSVASFTGPAAADAGDSFLLNWVVQNIGVGDTAVSSWFDRVVLSNDIVPGGDDLVLASVTHSGLLNSGGNYAVNNQLVQIPFTIAPGSYFLLLTTDSGNNVFEAVGEGNNLATPLPIVISRDESDLRVTAVSASGSAQSGGSLTVNWTVLNDSPVTTNANFWFDQVYLSANNVIDDGDTLLGTVQRSNALAPNAQYSVSRDFTLPQNITGQFFVIVRTDSSNFVVEGPFENNNDRAATDDVEVGLSLVPDLAVTNVNAPTDGFSGQPFQLSWTVSNGGQEATNGSWYDSVYLSLDQVFDRATDTYLGFANRPNNLAVGASYTQTQSFNIPAGFAGQYYVFVVADGNDRVFERDAELNNTRLDPVSMHVTLTPPADFVVGSVTVPTNGVPGQTATISYTVVNQGVNAAIGSWVDSVYLSVDDVWDINDPLVHRATRGGPVAGGTSYTETFTAPLPGVIPGDYHIIIRSDILNHIPESNEGNNIGVSLNQAALDFQELELGVTASGELAEGRTAYYKITVPAAETLSFLLNSNLGDGTNEVYVAFERVPTRSDYDFAAIVPFEVDQRALVPSTQAGTYFVAVYANDVISATESQFYELTAEFLPFDVNGTDISRVGAGPVSLLIEGSRFSDTTAFSLTDSTGQLFAGTVINVYDPTRALVQFELTNARPGSSTLGATNGLAIASADDAIEIGPSFVGDLSLSIHGPDNIRAGQIGTWTIDYANVGGTDIANPVLSVSLDGVSNFRLPGVPTTFEGHILLLAIEQDTLHTALRPGASGRITLYGQATRDVKASVVAIPRDELDNVMVDYSEFLAAENRQNALPVGSYPEYVTRLGATLGEVYSNLDQVLGALRDSRIDYLSVQNINGRWYHTQDLSEPSSARPPISEPMGVNDDAGSSEAAGDLRIRQPIFEPDGINGLDLPGPPVHTSGDGVNNTIVVVIGMEDYSNFAPGNNLNDTTADANAWADTFRDYYGVDPSDIIRINDKVGDGNTVTESVVTDAIRNSGADADDTLVIAYSGHGSNSGDWVMNGAGDAGFLDATELANAIQALGVGEAIVVSDSCFSGQMINDLNAKLSNFAGYAGTDTDSVAWEGDDLSLFTEKMLEQLRNGKTFDEAFIEAELYIVKKMLDKNPANQEEFQDPTSVNDDGVNTNKYDYKTWSEWLEEELEELGEDIEDWADQLEDWLRDRYEELRDQYEDFEDWLDDYYDDWWDDLTDFVESRDPNDILGPNGFGPEQWTTTAQQLNYTIRFENDPVFATAPAQVVRITQTLDSDLDFRTFRVGDFAIGTHFVDVPDNRAFYQNRLDLTAELGIFVDVFSGIDVTTGEAFWEFTSIDPATGEQPVDALAGFLPPNLTSPEGEGFVTYAVRPRATATTGTVIDAEARIIFDVNEPIDTPPIFNTLDFGLPTSSVSALPTAAETSTFMLSWSGADAEGGSGLAAFDIYVSANNGPFQAFLAHTTLTSAEFVGLSNTHYAFYSVARDNAGNFEAPPATPDAVTTTPPPVDAVPPAVTGITIQNGLTQRSYVDRLVIEFSEQLNLATRIGDGSITSAITLTNLGVDAPATADQQIALSPGQFRYEFDEVAGVSRLTWSFDQFAGGNASLLDGLYEFVIHASLVTDLAGNPFDGDSNGTAGDNFKLSFHRLSGDANGDRAVDASDMQFVNAALGSRPGVTAWNTNADLDRDGAVTTRDRLIVSRGTGNSIVMPVAGSGLAGDYNSDGTVDAADFVLWRKNFGATGPAALVADGNHDGHVDGSDLNVWRHNFGATTSSATENLAAVAFTASVEAPAAAASSSQGTEIAVVGQAPDAIHPRDMLLDLAFAGALPAAQVRQAGETHSSRLATHTVHQSNSSQDWSKYQRVESWLVREGTSRRDAFLIAGEEQGGAEECDMAFAQLFDETDDWNGAGGKRSNKTGRLHRPFAKVE